MKEKYKEKEITSVQRVWTTDRQQKLQRVNLYIKYYHKIKAREKKSAFYLNEFYVIFSIDLLLNNLCL